MDGKATSVPQQPGPEPDPEPEHASEEAAAAEVGTKPVSSPGADAEGGAETKPGASIATGSATNDTTARNGTTMEPDEDPAQPYLGRWFEDKSRGDVSQLGTFLTACNWGWASRQILTSAPNQMWEIKAAAGSSGGLVEQLSIGVEVNALMKKLISLVGAAPFVTYNCSGEPFEFELFTGVTARGTVHWGEDRDGTRSLGLHKVITAPEYVLQCEWLYRVTRGQTRATSDEAQASSPAQRMATCRRDYSPSFDGAIPMSEGERCELQGEVGTDWTRVRVRRAEGDVVVGHVPTSFLVLDAGSELMASAARSSTAAAATRDELRCTQTNVVFKRDDTCPDGKGLAVPEMDHVMEQVWVRATSAEHGMLGRLR